MHVYTSKEKRVVYGLKVQDQLKSWSQCKSYVKRSLSTKNKKLHNWYAYLLWKRVNRKRKSVFNFYLKKVLQKKFLYNTLLKGVTLDEH